MHNFTKLTYSKLVILLSLALQCCFINSDLYLDKTNEQFINDLINNNSVILYKNEIERTKLRFFPRANYLLYEFRKLERFNSNGSLFLQLMLKNNKNLNLSINKNEILAYTENKNYLIKKLHIPYDILNIKTGQILPSSRKTWFVNYKKHFMPDSIINDIESIEESREEKFNLYRHYESLNVLGNLGCNIFHKKNNVNIFFNPNSYKLVCHWANVIPQKDITSSFYIRYFKNIQDSIWYKEDVLNKTDICSYTSSELAIKCLEKTQIVEKIQIGQKKTGTNDLVWSKTFSLEELFHHTHIKLLNIKDFNSNQVETKSYTLLNFLITNTLKLIYFNKNLELYTNFDRSMFYLKYFDSDTINSDIKLCFISNKTSKVYKGDSLPYTTLNDPKKGVFKMFKIKPIENASQIKVSIGLNNSDTKTINL